MNDFTLVSPMSIYIPTTNERAYIGVDTARDNHVEGDWVYGDCIPVDKFWSEVGWFCICWTRST